MDPSGSTAAVGERSSEGRVLAPSTLERGALQGPLPSLTRAESSSGLPMPLLPSSSYDRRRSIAFRRRSSAISDQFIGTTIGHLVIFSTTADICIS
jgi:hypothetical protein